MSKVLVWKSDTDGKLFEDKTKYQKHLRKLAGHRALARQVAATEIDRELFLDKLGQAGSITELEQLIKDNWKWFYANGLARNQHRSNSVKHEYVEVSFASIRWSDNVSNSHRCPRGGITNWNSRTAAPGTPTGYPGWTGQIKIHIRASSEGYGSDYFDRTPVNTGGGGGGGTRNGVVSYSYSVELFASDFPVMWENRQKSEFWTKIGSTVDLVEHV